MDLLYNTVKSVIIFLILVTVVMNLLGNSTYKKYVGIFTGMILIMLILSPVVKLINMEDKLNYYLDSNYLIVQNENLICDITKAEQEQNNEIIKAYKETIKEQIIEILKKHEVYLVKIDIIIEEETKNENYGKILGLNMKVSHDKSQEDELLIDKVAIDDIRINDTNNQTVGIDYSLEQWEVSKIKKEIKSLYHLEEEKIKIVI